MKTDIDGLVDELHAIYAAKRCIRNKDALQLLSAYQALPQDADQHIEALLALGFIWACAKESADARDAMWIEDRELLYAVFPLEPASASQAAHGARRLPWAAWRSWMRQARAGDPQALNRVFDVCLHAGLKIAVVANMENRCEWEDLAQEIALGLMYAIRDYNVCHHGSFFFFMPLFVRKFMESAIECNTPLSRLVLSLDAPIGKGKRLGDVLRMPERQTPFEIVYRVYLRDYIGDLATNSYHIFHKEVLWARYGLSLSRVHSVKEVANLLDVSTERVQTTEKRALKNIRRLMNHWK